MTWHGQKRLQKLKDERIILSLFVIGGVKARFSFTIFDTWLAMTVVVFTTEVLEGLL